MRELELFYLKNCPYCSKARKAIEELREENPAFAALPIRWIEESEEPELAGSRDYYYVPALFYGENKLYETDPAHDYNKIKEEIRSAFASVPQADFLQLF